MDKRSVVGNDVRITELGHLTIRSGALNPSPSILPSLGAVTCLYLSQDGATLVSGSKDKCVGVWMVK